MTIGRRGGETAGRPPAGPGLRFPRPLAGLAARMDYRLRTLGVAVALGLLAVALTLAYVRSYKRSVRAAAASVEVVVAARDIAVGTQGSALATGPALEVARVPRDTVVPGAISGRTQLEGTFVAERIYLGEQISLRRFRRGSEQGVRGDLNGTMRAISLAGDGNQLLAGLLRNGDRVDVLASFSAGPGGSSERAWTRIILRDVLVLRAPQAPATGGAAVGGQRTASIVLALTDRQAQKLFFAAENGKWSLLLRPFARSADSPGETDTVATVLGASKGRPSTKGRPR